MFYLLWSFLSCLIPPHPPSFQGPLNKPGLCEEWTGQWFQVPQSGLLPCKNTLFFTAPPPPMSFLSCSNSSPCRLSKMFLFVLWEYVRSRFLTLAKQGAAKWKPQLGAESGCVTATTVLVGWHGEEEHAELSQLGLVNTLARLPWLHFGTSAPTLFCLLGC